MTEADRRKVHLRELVDKNRATLIIWDWKESVPLEDISLAAQRGFVHMYMVDDTFSDSYAAVASMEPLNTATFGDEVQDVFEMLEAKYAGQEDNGTEEA